MSSKIMIDEVKWNDEKLLLLTNNKEDQTLSPTGRMLADSDGLAFIYILETADSYVYVSISNNYWSDLKKALDQHNNVYIMINSHEILLEGMEEELLYLISNIDGNANYGDVMMKEVERVFL